MSGWRWMAAVWFAVACVRSGAAAQPAAALPTMDELRQELKEGKDYPALLQRLTRVLQLKGNAAAPYDRVELQMMRGEALLHLKQQAAGVQAFQAALKESSASDPKNPRDPVTLARQQREARVMLMLLGRSQNYEYKPKMKPAAAGAPAGPFSVLDPEQRKAAYKSMFDESMVDAAAKAKAARAGKTLGPVVDAVRSLIELRALEETVSGGTVQTDGLLKDCAARAGELMGDEVARAEKVDDAIDKAAHETVLLPSTGTGGNSGPARYRYKGLSNADKQTLKANVDGLQKIGVAAHDFEELGPAAAGAANFKKIATSADAAAGKGTQTLNDNYNVMLSSPRTTR